MQRAFLFGEHFLSIPVYNSKRRDSKVDMNYLVLKFKSIEIHVRKRLLIEICRPDATEYTK